MRLKKKSREAKNEVRKKSHEEDEVNKVIDGYCKVFSQKLVLCQIT